MLYYLTVFGKASSLSQSEMWRCSVSTGRCQLANWLDPMYPSFDWCIRNFRPRELHIKQFFLCTYHTDYSTEYICMIALVTYNLASIRLSSKCYATLPTIPGLLRIKDDHLLPLVTFSVYGRGRKASARVSLMRLNYILWRRVCHNQLACNFNPMSGIP